MTTMFNREYIFVNAYNNNKPLKFQQLLISLLNFKLALRTIITTSNKRKVLIAFEMGITV